MLYTSPTPLHHVVRFLPLRDQQPVHWEGYHLRFLQDLLRDKLVISERLRQSALDTLVSTPNYKEKQNEQILKILEYLNETKSKEELIDFYTKN